MKLNPQFEIKLTARQKLGVLFTRLFSKATPGPAANPEFLRMRAAGELKPVFEVNGRTYCKYVYEEKIPPFRAFAALDFYDALERKADPLYLEAFCKSVLELVNDNKIGEIAILTHFLYQRLQSCTNIELIYDLATVLYIDETEDPNDFDFNFAFEKKKLWQTEPVKRFFLRTPLKEYLPYSEHLERNLGSFTADQREQQITQLTVAIQILSEKGGNSALVTRLATQVEALQNTTHC